MATQKITPRQAAELAESLYRIHDVIDGHVRDNINALPADDRQRLQKLAVKLYQEANDFVEYGVDLVLDDLQVGVNGLNRVTTKVRDALAKIKKTKEIIVVATEVLSFVTTLMTGDLKKTVQAAKKLYEVAGATGKAEDDVKG